MPGPAFGDLPHALDRARVVPDAGRDRPHAHRGAADDGGRYLTFDPAIADHERKGFLYHQAPPNWPAYANGRSVLFGLVRAPGLLARAAACATGRYLRTLEHETARSTTTRRRSSPTPRRC